MPARLSGGQQHRVALGRLLLAHCRALLLDEPYSGLDAALRRTLTGAGGRAGVGPRRCPRCWSRTSWPTRRRSRDRMAVLDRGAVLQAGAPDEVVRRPASRRVAELVGYLGFVPVAAAGPGVPVAGDGR